jgi:hypothetical protein
MQFPAGSGNAIRKIPGLFGPQAPDFGSLPEEAVRYGPAYAPGRPGNQGFFVL